MMVQAQNLDAPSPTLPPPSASQDSAAARHALGSVNDLTALSLLSHHNPNPDPAELVSLLEVTTVTEFGPQIAHVENFSPNPPTLTLTLTICLTLTLTLNAHKLI